MLTELMTPSGKPKELPLGLDLGSIQVPDRLPPLVKHYLIAGRGEEIPVVESALLWGRWRMRMGPVWMPGTWRVHYRFPERMGRTMRLYLARIPVLPVTDTCDLVKKEARTTLAHKVLDQGGKVVEAAAMVLWLDSFVFRSTAALREDVQWQETGTDTVAMTYPSPMRPGERDELRIAFGDSGDRIERASAMRWKSTKAAEKDPWRVDVHASRQLHGQVLPSEFSITWERQGGPWSYWYLGGGVLNPQGE